MNLGTIKPAILAVVAAAAGCPAVWRDQKSPYVGSDRVLAVCKLSGIQARGSFDETRWTYDADRPLYEEMLETVVAWREMTLSVQVRSLDTTDAKDAMGYLQTLNARLRLREHIDALAVVNVSFAGVRALVENSAPTDEHIVSMATLDVRLTHTFQEDASVGESYIETVETEGEITS